MASDFPRIILSVFIASILLVLAFLEIGWGIIENVNIWICLFLVILGAFLATWGMIKFLRTRGKLYVFLMVLGTILVIFFGLFQLVGWIVPLFLEYIAFIFLGLGVIFLMIGEGLFKRWFLGGIMILLGAVYLISYFGFIDIGILGFLMPGEFFHIILLIFLGIIMILNAFPQRGTVMTI